MKDLHEIAFQLNEAAMHLQSVASELKDGKIGQDDDVVLEIQLGHVLDHICHAWNSRDLSIEQRSAQTQKEFEDMTDAVPNFQLCRRLLPGTTYGEA